MNKIQNYHEMLREVNEDVRYLMREDVADEVPDHLERFGFRRISGFQILKFRGDGFEITYKADREQPFMVDLQKENEGTSLEVNKILENILLEVLENI